LLVRNYLSISSDLSALTTGEIRGAIEKPDYYLNNNNPNASVDLDILLMTQGWRRFLWQAVLEKKLQASYEVETGISLKGFALKPNGKPTAKPAEISLLCHPEKGTTEVLTSSTNAQGKFIFPQLDFNGESSVMIQGVKEKGGRDLLLSLDEYKLPTFTPLENVIDPVNLKDRSPEIRLMEHYMEMKAKLAMSKTKVLKEVTVTAQRIRDDRRLLYSGHDVQKVEVNNDNCYTASSVLQLLQGRVAGVQVVYQNPTHDGGVYDYTVVIRGRNTLIGESKPPAYLLDGFVVSLDVVSNIRPCAVESIEVITHVFPMLNSNGVISILTRHGNPNYTQPQEPIPGRMVTRVRGYHVTKEFYSPKYIDSTSIKKEVPDFRSTLYWNPLIKTDAEGHAKVTFWNSDETTTMHANLQGISHEGESGCVTTEYKVE